MSCLIRSYTVCKFSYFLYLTLKELRYKYLYPHMSKMIVTSQRIVNTVKYNESKYIHHTVFPATRHCYFSFNTFIYILKEFCTLYHFRNSAYLCSYIAKREVQRSYNKSCQWWCSHRFSNQAGSDSHSQGSVARQPRSFKGMIGFFRANSFCLACNKNKVRLQYCISGIISHVNICPVSSLAL